MGKVIYDGEAYGIYYPKQFVEFLDATFPDLEKMYEFNGGGAHTFCFFLNPQQIGVLYQSHMKNEGINGISTRAEVELFGDKNADTVESIILGAAGLCPERVYY